MQYAFISYFQLYLQHNLKQAVEELFQAAGSATNTAYNEKKANSTQLSIKLVLSLSKLAPLSSEECKQHKGRCCALFVCPLGLDKIIRPMFSFLSHKLKMLGLPSRTLFKLFNIIDLLDMLNVMYSTSLQIQ